MLGEETFLKGLTFKVAEPAERERVLELRREVYGSALGHEGIDAFDEGAYHLIATNEQNDVVAAFRMIGPSQRPFELEDFVELARFIDNDRRPAVLDRFCIRKDYRSVSRRQLIPIGMSSVSRRQLIPIGMLKLAVDFARKQRVTDFVILALPHLRSFYRAALFRPCGVVFKHPTWGEVHLMHLDLIELTASATRSAQPMARFILRTDLPNFRI